MMQASPGAQLVSGCAGNAVASAASAAAAKGQSAFTSANASAAALQVTGERCGLQTAMLDRKDGTLRSRQHVSNNCSYCGVEPFV